MVRVRVRVRVSVRVFIASCTGVFFEESHSFVSVLLCDLPLWPKSNACLFETDKHVFSLDFFDLFRVA